VRPKDVCRHERLGVDKVFDTNWGADLTIIEEKRTSAPNQQRGVLPMSLPLAGMDPFL
jgi:iron only hydrogenase large subunit-like protein